MWRSVPAVARNGFRTPAKNPLSRVFARYASAIPLEKLRNFGVSAHIDSGKTTLTERILYYTGKIDKIHEVRGKDGVGAVMDSMKQERERGITIKSAATFAQWGETYFNIIDTPGHIDFTVEVERSLRVLDGAILVVCAVGGVQSQTITVDRQMKRYNVPRVVFINKLDRKESKDVKITVSDLNHRLGINSGLVTIPNGYGHSPLGCEGIVDIIDQEYVTFEGPNGVDVTRSSDIPADIKEEVDETRALLIEKLAEVDEELGEKYIMEEDITPADIKAAIRRTTIARTFCPVYCGSAKGNFGVQLVLNAVAEFLPNPTEVPNYGIIVKDGEEEQVTLKSDPKEDLIAMVFKLDIVNNKTLAYVRVYQGTLKKGDTVRIAPRGSANWKEAKTAKISKLVKLHSNNFIEVDKVPAGEIAGIEAFECASGDTLVNAMSKTMTSCESIFIPVPVISATLFPQQISDLQNLLAKLKRFEKEDPTFQCAIDHETKDITISGMGELHLDIFVQRLMSEENIAVRVGEPFVQYREYLPASEGDEIKFDYRHKKQSGGRGQFAQMSGYMTRSASELSTKDTTPKNTFDSTEVTGVCFFNTTPPPHPHPLLPSLHPPSTHPHTGLPARQLREEHQEVLRGDVRGGTAPGCPHLGNAHAAAGGNDPRGGLV